MDTSDGREYGQWSTPAHDMVQADVWVFAYGSLMWRPDFQPAEALPARLFGWRRTLCILSTVYRGTDQKPGLVLGLDRGGSCRGRVLKVPCRQWPEVKARLDARELVTGVYRPRFLPARLDDGGVVPAYTYVVVRDHWQYWHGDRAEAIRLLRQGQGQAGTARDYLAQTVTHLSALGVRASTLHSLLKSVDAAPAGDVS